MRKLVAFVLASAIALAACSGGSADGGAEGPTATGGGATSPTGAIPPTEGPSPTEEPSPSEEPAGSPLVGVWTIQLQDKLAALLEPYGGVPPGLRCRGAENLTFGEDGSFLAAIAGRCEFQTASGGVEGEWAGEYRDEGDAFVLIDVRGSISAEVQGMSVPLASWERVTDPVPYRVAGERLTFRFAMPDGATVELTYRAA